MDRIVFTKMLVSAKRKSGISTTDMVFKMHALPNAIYRIESAKFSFSMEKCLSYLEVVGYAIRFMKNGRETIVSNMKELIDWEVGVRGQMSKPVFSERLGCNRSYIRLIESGQCAMSIDFVLKIADTFGYEVSLTKFSYEQ